MGEWLALGTAFSWTMAILFFEAASKRIGSQVVNLIRLAFAVLLISLFCYLWRGQALPLDASGNAWFWLCISGIIGFVIGDFCFFKSLVLIGSRISSLIFLTLSPIFTALIGRVILREALSLRHWAAMGIIITGVLIVILERKETDPAKKGTRATDHLKSLGILLALLAALGQALGAVLGKLGMGTYDAIASTQIRIIAASTSLALAYLVTGRWKQLNTAFKDGKAIWQTMGGAFFGPFVGVGLFQASIRLIPAGITAMIVSLVPILLIPISVFFLKQRISLKSVIGALLAVFGVSILFW